MSKALKKADYINMAKEIKDLAYPHKPWYTAPLGEMVEEYVNLGPLDNGAQPDYDLLLSAVNQLAEKEKS
jgi:hypothetical protein